MAFNNVWTVISLDSGAPESTIMGWIGAAGIPSCFRFVFQSPFANAWRIMDVYGSSIPMPFAPWTIIVSSATDPRFKWVASGMATPSFHQASMGHWTGEASDELGARMWHEILHCYEIPADNMQTTERAEFTDYLRSTGSIHYAGFSQDPVGYEKSVNHTRLLIEFYTYLTHKYLGCQCFSEGCEQFSQPQPDVSSNDVLTPSEPSSDSNDMTKKLLYAAAIVGVFLLIF